MNTRTKVRLVKSRPLPSGATVKLVGFVSWINEDGSFDVNIATPGMYGGGVIRDLREADIEIIN